MELLKLLDEATCAQNRARLELLLRTLLESETGPIVKAMERAAEQMRMNDGREPSPADLLACIDMVLAWEKEDDARIPF